MRVPSIKPKPDPLDLVEKAVGGRSVHLGTVDAEEGQKLLDDIDRRADEAARRKP